jgi:hypothetical protein
MSTFIIAQIKTRDEIPRQNNVKLEVKTPLFDQSNERNFRNVHYYDNHCEKLIFPSYNQEEKINMAKHLQSLFTNNLARLMLNVIISRNNYDPSNQVDSFDMLFWICTHPITAELFDLLEEQIADNSALGQCLQGSSHRIKQIYYAQADLS